MNQSLDELLNECTVKVILPGTTDWGTGFFVSRGLIVTCAHVVKGFEDELIQVQWRGQTLAKASVEYTLKASVEYTLSEQLDLALLKCELPQGILPPCVWLDSTIESYSNLYVYGYPDHFPEGSSVTIQSEGTAREQEIKLIKFKGGQIRPGYSGSPVLNKATGKVCAIVSDTLGKSTDLGGLAIPVTELLKHFKDIEKANQEFHRQDHRWQQALKTNTQPNIRKVTFPNSGATSQLITTPPNLNNLVKREEEVNIIQSWLDNPQICTVGIQGLGGTGKSIIASYFFHHSNFVDQFWADVTLNPDFTVFAEKIINALGGKVSFRMDVTELINNLLNLLSQRRCLLVVDNLEALLNAERNWQSESYQKFFSRWLQQGTNSTLLVTTQDKPRLFQTIQSWYALGGMKITEGVELFNKFGIIAKEDKVKKFVEYIQGHPLTIRLVAGFLISYCDSQLSQIEELKLEQHELAYQQAKGSHRNKNSARLAWIIQQHLSRLGLERTGFLINLSVYRLPFNREAARYMWQEKKVEPIELQKEIQELCNRSLLVKTEDRKFKFETLVQKFIQLTQQQKYDLTNAHKQAIEYYQDNLEEEESGRVLLDLEIIYHHCELKQYAQAFELLDSCAKFLYVRGYYEVLVETYENLLHGWQSNLQPEDRYHYAISINNLGSAHYSRGEYEQALELYQQSLKISREIGSSNGQALSLNNLGDVFQSMGKYEKAIKLYQESLEISQKNKDADSEAVSFGGLGSVHLRLGEYEEVIKYYQQSLEISKRIGDLSMQTVSLSGLGDAYYYLGEYKEATKYHQKSLKISEEIGHVFGQTLSLNNLGNVHLRLGEYKEAIEYHQKSLKISEEIGHVSGQACCINDLGLAHFYLGEYQKSVKLYQKSLEISQRIGNINNKANSLGNLGHSYLALEEYKKAIDLFEESLIIFQEIGDKRGEADSLQGLGSVYDAIEEYKKAIDLFKESLTIFQEIGDKKGEADSLKMLGFVYSAIEEYNKASNCFNESVRISYEITGKLPLGLHFAGKGIEVRYFMKSLE